MKITPFPRTRACVVGPFLTWQGAVHAQSDWPNKAVRIVAAIAPGGSSERAMVESITGIQP